MSRNRLPSAVVVAVTCVIAAACWICARSVMPELSPAHDGDRAGWLPQEVAPASRRSAVAEATPRSAASATLGDTDTTGIASRSTRVVDPVAAQVLRPAPFTEPERPSPAFASVPARRDRPSRGATVAAGLGYGSASPEAHWLDHWLDHSRRATAAVLDRPPGEARIAAFNEQSEVRRTALVARFGATAASEIALRLPLRRMRDDGSIVRIDGAGRELPSVDGDRD